MRKITLFFSILFLWTCGGGGGSGDKTTGPVVPDIPIVQNINSVTPEDIPVSIVFLSNQTSSTFAITGNPQNGIMVVAGSSGIYTPNPNYFGTDTIGYVATSTAGNSNIGLITIIINAVNDAPVANDIVNQVTDENRMTQLNITLDAVDVDGDNLAYSVVSSNNGSINIDGAIATYIPTQDWNGTDTFTYKANDGIVDSNIATVTITVNAINDAPVVEDMRVTLNENRFINSMFDAKENSEIKFAINSNRSGSVDIVLTGSDPDGDTLVFSIVETNAGAVSLENNIATYTPSQDWNGVDTFSFKAFDGLLESNVAKVILTVNPQNDAPTVKDLTITTSEDTDIEFVLDGTDIDGDNLNYSIVTDVAIDDNNIELENNTGPNVLFEPDSNWYGTEQFTYKANDGSFDSNTAQVTLVVLPINDAPIANDVAVTINETRTAKTYFALNGTDVDGDNLQYLIVNNVNNGTLSLNGSEVNYIPNQDFVGQDTLTYKVNDSLLDSNIATAVITISAVNDAPVSEDVYASTDEDNSVSLTLLASDIDSSSLTYVVSSLPENGTISQTGSSIEYQPNSNWNGQDNLQFYAVDEDSKSSNISYAYIQVNPMEDAPYFAGDSLDWYYTLEYGIQDTFSFSLDSVDADGDNITWSTVESTTPFTFNSDQSEIYIVEGNVHFDTSYAVNVYGTDDKGNAGAAGTISLALIGGPTGIKDVIEVDHNWEDSTSGNNTTGDFNGNEGSWLRDPAVSYVPWASLGRTGYIIENRAGTVNTAPNARDFDRFDYWSTPSQFDIELDFSQQSLAWDYINETINGYVPFSAYLIDNFTNEKTQLFAGYWDHNGNTTFDLDGSQWTGPVYGANSWEPIYLFWHLGTPYDPSKDSQYVSDNNLTTSGGCGWACSGAAPMQSSNSALPPVTPTYPIMTATLFTDYLDTGLLPTAAGHIAYGTSWNTASSIIFDTEYEYYDTPQGNNDDSSRRDNFIQYDDNALPQFENNRQRNQNENINVSPFNYEPEK
ncbi:Ig-like domain-containing protein [Candidatus Marinimicrobia bacterium]|nr:Ig-like domain-containing protein [Candidatus Neomarinimicrobiota bacterium]